MLLTNQVKHMLKILLKLINWESEIIFWFSEETTLSKTVMISLETTTPRNTD